MTLQVTSTVILRTLMGAGKKHDPNRSYGEEILELLNSLWEVVRARGIQTKGINHVVYGADGEIFAGVEPLDQIPSGLGLEKKDLRIGRHAYWKHVGPYHLLSGLQEEIIRSLRQQRLRSGYPIVEIYDHWTEDESKLETEIIYPLV